MSFCVHLGRGSASIVRVLRALRQVRTNLRDGNCSTPESALELALEVRRSRVPHLEWEDEGGQVVH